LLYRVTSAAEPQKKQKKTKHQTPDSVQIVRK